MFWKKNKEISSSQNKNWQKITNSFLPYIVEEIRTGEILDLGKAENSNIEYFTNRGFKVTVLDISNEGEFNNFFEKLENKIYNLVLVWTTILHLPNDKMSEIAAYLEKVVANKGYLIVYSFTRKRRLLKTVRFRLNQRGELYMETPLPISKLPFQYPTLREIENLFKNLKPVKNTLLNNGLLEIVMSKKPL